jgi:hypothetical protein
MSYRAVDLPKTPDGAFASIATDAGSMATVFCVFSTNSTAPPLTIVDWSLDDLTPNSLSRIVPAAAAWLASLREQIHITRSPPPDVILIDSGGAGGPLCEQAIAAGWGQVEAITEGGALKYPLLPDRVMAASFYLTCGAVAIARSALEYDLLHRGVIGNHLVRALKAFGTSKEQSQPSVLLVAVVNAVLEAFVDRNLKVRAITEFAP